MFTVGQSVTLLAPFNLAYPGTFIVLSINTDGSYQVSLSGTDDPTLGTTFDSRYLQAA